MAAVSVEEVEREWLLLIERRARGVTSAGRGAATDPVKYVNRYESLDGKGKDQ